MPLTSRETLIADFQSNILGGGNSLETPNPWSYIDFPQTALH